MAGAAPPLVPPPGRFSRAGVAPSDAPSSAATAKSAPRGVAVAAPGGSRSAASMEQRLAAFRAARRTLADRPGPAKPPAEAAAPATEQAQAQAQAQLRPPAELENLKVAAHDFVTFGIVLIKALADCDFGCFSDGPTWQSVILGKGLRKKHLM